MPLLCVEDLTVHFEADGRVARAVDGVDFSIEENRILGLVGESGCGKSVTALSILQLLSKKTLKRFSGRIEFDGRDLMQLSDKDLRSVRGSQIAMIFQEPMTSLNPVLTVGRQIDEVLRLHLHQNRAQAVSNGLELLDLVGISEGQSVWKAYPGQLSGGMRQRVMIAMAMAARPKLLIADEPTTALDVTIQAQVLALIDRMRQKIGVGVLLVTHDLGVVAEVCDEVCVMYAGRPAERAGVQAIFDRPLHPYTQGLLAAVRHLDQGDVRTAIPGQVDPATDYPAGCRFHPRCPKVMEKCRKIVPEPNNVEGSIIACHLFP